MILLWQKFLMFYKTKEICFALETLKFEVFYIQKAKCLQWECGYFCLWTHQSCSTKYISNTHICIFVSRKRSLTVWSSSSWHNNCPLCMTLTITLLCHKKVWEQQLHTEYKTALTWSFFSSYKQIMIQEMGPKLGIIEAFLSSEGVSWKICGNSCTFLLV